MFKVTKELSFCYGHRLLNYNGKCRYLHGHNARVEIELSARSLDRRGMVVDFSDVKRAVQGWIDTALDHKMLLNKKDSLIPHLRKIKEPVVLLDSNPTAENLAKLVFDYCKQRRFPVTEVRFWETPRSFAAYKQARS